MAADSKTCVRIGVGALLAASMFPVLFFAATPDTGEINRVLADVPWVSVAAREHVKFGQQAWSGPDDLSFRYRMSVREGTLWLWVSVRDDKPGIAGKSWMSSDHVELWLADPALAEDYQAQITGVRETIQQFEERLKDDSCNDMEAEFLADQKDLLAKLKKDVYFTQFLFEPCEEVSSPYDNRPCLAGLHGTVPAEGGYEFFARIPLFGTFDLKRSSLKQLAFLVDVVDVDEPGAAKQKALMSSSERRVYADPSSFQAMVLDPPYRPPIPSCDKIEESFAGKGFWKAGKNGYEFVAWGEEAWSGCYGTDRSVHPGYWGPLPEPIAVPPDFTVSVLPVGTRLLVSQGGQCAIVDLEKYVHAAGGIAWVPLFRGSDDEATYLVLEATGLSRWPGGSTNCGAGTESDLLWIKLDRSLKVRALDGVHYESCFEFIEVEENVVGGRAASVRFVQWKGGAKKSARVTYDNAKPSLGLVRE